MKGEKEGEGVPSVVLTRSPTAPGHVPGLWHRRTYQAAIGTRVPRVLTECFVQLQGSQITHQAPTACAPAVVSPHVPTEVIQRRGVG